MRTLYKYIAVAMLAISVTSCEWEAADNRDTQPLATLIWRGVAYEIDNVNEMLATLLQLDYWLGLEEESARDEYKSSYLADIEITSKGQESYEIKGITKYSTYYTINVKTNGKRLIDGNTWIMERNGGVNYQASITSKGGSVYESTMNITAGPSYTTADLEVTTILDSKDKFPTLAIEYSGTITKVDEESSAEYPVQIVAEVTEPIYYTVEDDMTMGVLAIECCDKLYDSRDCIRVEILREYGTVKIEYLSDIFTYTYKTKEN